MSKQLLVIGGGAAGFFCAVNAARMHPGLEVTILEKSGKLLSKVRISGGGRCNTTHACFDIREMSKRYPRGEHFVKKTFHQFFTVDTVQWFEERGVILKAEEDGRMFPETNSSQTIIDCLLKEANRYGVKIRTNTDVKKVHVRPPIVDEPNGQPSFTGVECFNGEIIKADYLCIACGGFPKPGMFDWLTGLGHTIEDPVPSLFTFNLPGHPITQLMGVSVDKARVKIAGTKLEQEGPLLITHWGMSGPVVLKLSAWGARQLAATSWQFSIVVNWLPAYHENALQQFFQSIRFDRATQKIVNRNPFGLPVRLWEFLVGQSGIDPEKRWADLAAREQNILVRNLCAGEFTVNGKTTFKEEFVTAGGIRLEEINAQTMMSRKIANLFFAGEIMDVDGITGGYNFQHAWTSGFIAAKSIASQSMASEK